MDVGTFIAFASVFIAFLSIIFVILAFSGVIDLDFGIEDNEEDGNRKNVTSELIYCISRIASRDEKTKGVSRSTVILYSVCS